MLELTTYTNFFSSIPVLLAMHTLSMGGKVAVLGMYLYRRPQTTQSRMPHLWLFPIIIIACALYLDIVWSLGAIKHAWPHLALIKSHRIALVRLSWICFVAQYTTLSIFLERLCSPTAKLSWWAKAQILWATSINSIYLYFIIAHHDVVDFSERYAELVFLQYGVILLYPLMCYSIFRIAQIMRTNTLPKILRKQLFEFITRFILPYLFLEAVQTNPMSLTVIPNTQLTLPAYASFVLTAALYFCTRKLLNIRFLNTQQHVQLGTTAAALPPHLADAIEQLGLTTDRRTLELITRTFFKENFSIPVGRVLLNIRDAKGQQTSASSSQERVNTIERFHVDDSSAAYVAREYLYKHKIILKDEIEFTHFYQQDPALGALIELLNSISAEIFIGLYDGSVLLGYLVIEHDLRSHTLYSEAERNQMAIFANFLSTTLKLLNSEELQQSAIREKSLREQLHTKQQLIAQYHETMRSFLRRTSTQRFGILLYKNRTYLYVNQHAQDVLGFNMNVHQGHQAAKDIRSITRKAVEFNTEQSIITYDAQGEPLTALAIPSLESNHVLIIMHHPGVTEILEQQVKTFKDPIEWDYLLYLETTESGRLINQLIPSNAETLVKCKLDLLKLVLSNKAALLEIPYDDLLATIEVIHHLSGRKQLHVLRLNQAADIESAEAKIFGINQLLLDPLQANTRPLLEQLHNGTLLIENFQLLPLNTQALLANFIKSGYFASLRSSIKQSSDVRILFYSPQDASDLVANQKIDQELFQILQESRLALPSLLTLPEAELEDLVRGIAYQAIKTEPYKNLLELTESEVQRVIEKKCTSIQEFRACVQQALHKKSTKNNIVVETSIDTFSGTSDPRLIEAARLGKHALKDAKIMALLWNKFKNQNKIATFLGVNRSSVNRRCREYNLV